MPSIIAEHNQHNPQTSSPLDCSQRNRSHLPPGVGSPSKPSCKNRGTRRPCNDGCASIASCLLERLFSLLGPALGCFGHRVINGRYQPSYLRTSQPSTGRRKRWASQASGETSNWLSESPKLKAAPKGPAACNAKSPVCRKPGCATKPKLSPSVLSSAPTIRPAYRIARDQ